MVLVRAFFFDFCVFRNLQAMKLVISFVFVIDRYFIGLGVAPGWLFGVSLGVFGCRCGSRQAPGGSCRMAFARIC